MDREWGQKVGVRKFPHPVSASRRTSPEGHRRGVPPGHPSGVSLLSLLALLRLLSRSLDRLRFGSRLSLKVVTGDPRAGLVAVRQHVELDHPVRGRLTLRQLVVVAQRFGERVTLETRLLVDLLRDHLRAEPDPNAADE